MTVTTVPQTARSSDVAQYNRDGFLIVRGVLAPTDIAALDAEANRLLQRTDLMDTNNIRCRWQDDTITGECRFDCFDPVIDLSAEFDRVAHHAGIVDVVSALYGERACLFKDKLIFKSPGASGYHLHQDYIAWPSFPTSFVTVIVAIDPADRENGATEVFKGYHRVGNMTSGDGQYHRLPDDAIDESTGALLELESGDIAVFSGYTPHRSGPNRSDRWRRLFYLSYNAFSDGGEQREQHYAEFKTWLSERYAEHGKPFTFFR
jgi:ectoine hydroxylase-related dioxygenase (phytanoyl-CoA dioxygenase family)